MTALVRIENKFLWRRMKMKKESFFLFPLLLLIIGLVSCSHEDSMTIVSTDVSSENPKLETWEPLDNFSVQLTNNSSEDVSFWMYAENGVNYRNSTTILNSIINEGMSDKEKALEIWKLCYKSSLHHPFTYNHHLPDNYDPKALVTFPYLLCGEKTAILSTLASLSNLKTRVIQLNEHLVPEVFYNNSWHMFDADKGIVFLNEKNEIASIQDLVNQIDLVNENNILKCDPEHAFNIKEYKKMVEGVQIDYSNLDTTFVLNNYKIKNMDLKLRPGDVLVFSFDQSSAWDQWIYPRYKYHCEGYFERTIQLKDYDKGILYQENIPYIIKKIEISGDKSDVALLLKNRISHQVEETHLGKLEPNSILSQEFNGPSESDLYYDYEIKFLPTGTATNEKITVRTYFDFNGLTSPFSQANPIVFDWFEGEKLHLSQIQH